MPELENDFKQKIEHIVSALREAGYDPYEQLYAYLHTGNDTYITRKGNARTLVTELDREQIWNYIEPPIRQIIWDLLCFCTKVRCAAFNELI